MDWAYVLLLFILLLLLSLLLFVLFLLFELLEEEEEDEEFGLGKVGVLRILVRGMCCVGRGKNINLAEYLGKVRVVRMVKMAASVSRRGERGVGETHQRNFSATDIISDVKPHPIP